MQHPPLAILTNEFIRALNELRKCAPASSSHILSVHLRECLDRIVSTMTSLNGGKERVEEQGLRTYFTMCKCVVDDFVGFICQCFERIYPSGPTSEDTVLDKDQIVKPLSSVVVSLQERVPAEQLVEPREEKRNVATPVRPTSSPMLKRTQVV